MTPEEAAALQQYFASQRPARGLGTVEQHPEPPLVRIKLERGQRGGYGWEVAVSAATIDAALVEVRRANAQLAQEFGG
jgi:hypothetical protein